MNNYVDLHKILNFSDLEAGYKKLKRKKKYRDPKDSQVPSRYIPIEEREENLLKKFLEREVKTVEQRRAFFETLANYRPHPYSAYAIDKGSNKGFRPLLVPTPQDRLVFDAILPKYYSLLEPSLKQRKLLGIGLVKKQKVSSILHETYNNYIKQGYNFALTIDYSAFFSNIDRDILFKKFKKDFGGGTLYDLLKVVITNQVENGTAVSEKTGIDIIGNGIPQGLSFSPLIASYYALDIDDIYLSDSNVVGYRYIDDLMLFSKDKSSLEAVFNKIERKSQDLKMKPHKLGVEKSKTELKDIQDKPIKFLGVEISVSGGLQISDDKFKEILKVARDEIFNPRVIGKPEKIIKSVYYNYIRGWLNHYEQIHPNPPELHKQIDEMLFSGYFNKLNVRRKFYKEHSWIVISNNYELLQKPKRKRRRRRR